jgi:hypothetical protein
MDEWMYMHVTNISMNVHDYDEYYYCNHGSFFYLIIRGLVNLEAFKILIFST